MRLLRYFLVVLPVLFSGAYGAEKALDSLVDQAPLVQPQADGVVYLNVEAAALVSLETNNHPLLINQEGGVLKIDNGALATWETNRQLPFWRIELPKAGRYRVVINHATNPGRESAAEISFIGAKTHAVTGDVASTGGWDIFASTSLGEVNLDAGDTLVKFRPTRWTHPQWVIKLADIRLIPLDDLQRLTPAANACLGKLGVNADPKIAALKKRHDQLLQQIDAENKIIRNKGFATYTGYGQFLAFDQATAQFAGDQEEEKKVAVQLDLLQQQKLKNLAKTGTLTPAERSDLDAYFAAESALLDGATRVYPKLYFLPQTPAVATHATAENPTKPLFPTGHFDELQEQPIDTDLPAINLKLSPPADLVERKARFTARDTDEGIAALCRDFHAVIKPGVAGLADFYRLYDAGQYRQALDAYRAYFFAKLAEPEKYGAVKENLLFELARDRGKGELLFRPNPKALDYNLHDCAVAEVGHQLVVGQVGPPGSVCWAPPDMALPPGALYGYNVMTPPEFWKSPAGIDLALKHNFFRSILLLPSDRGEYASGGFFNALLFSYVTTGNKDHLQRWSDYLDDWTMNADRDEENCSFSPQKATELETQMVRCELLMLRIVSDERPEFAQDFNSATLVRFLMHLEEDYAPYVIRAKRTEMANWGMMGLCHNLHVAQFLSEFRASDYVQRESWRLWNINCIQHNTLDGENIEAWDTGHSSVAPEFANDSIPFVNLPPEADALDKTRFWDALKFNLRDYLVHISPAGFYWPPESIDVDAQHNDLANRFLKPDAEGHYIIEKIVDEKGAKQRIETILNGGKPGKDGPPPSSSDFAPYASMTYLRDSWQPGADYFILQDFRHRSQGAVPGRGTFSLSTGGRGILNGLPLIVDGKPDNRFYGQPRTGGKTDFCAEADTSLSPDRFYTSPQYDFAEATQDSPYAYFRVFQSSPEFGNPGCYRATSDGKDDPNPITGVIDHRHIFHLRGSGVWIVNDRIENKAHGSHQYAQFVGVPARLPGEGFDDRVRLLQAAHYPLIEEDSAQARVRTANPGVDNVSACFVAPVGAVVGTRLVNGTMAPATTSALDNLKEGRKRGATIESNCDHLFGVAWNGEGNQSLVTALYSRSTANTLDSPFANDFSTFTPVREADHRAGCHLTTPAGVEVWFESGPETVNSLTCGPVSADAEALFVTRRDGKIGGLLLGGTKVRVAGREMAVTSPDGEFSIDAQNNFTETGTIRRAIDTVQISPAGDVFIDQAKISFAIPTQDTRDIDYHYTLDGSDPTLDSPLYNGPFTITAATLVKVRPFRKGLKETPWNISGTDAGITASALFRKQAPYPPVTAQANLQAGLGYHYYEGPWSKLFTYTALDGVLTPTSSGQVRTLLDPAETTALRKTDRAYAIRYSGYMQVPATDIYTIAAPAPLYESILDVGYDLRVFIDGHEWYPAPALHSRNAWNVALQKGLHAISVTYVDYRWKTFRNDYWMTWHPEEMWQGTPQLEIATSGLARQPIPTSWFVH